MKCDASNEILLYHVYPLTSRTKKKVAVLAQQIMSYLFIWHFLKFSLLIDAYWLPGYRRIRLGKRAKYH